MMMNSERILWWWSRTSNRSGGRNFLREKEVVMECVSGERMYFYKDKGNIVFCTLNKKTIYQINWTRVTNFTGSHSRTGRT